MDGRDGQRDGDDFEISCSRRSFHPLAVRSLAHSEKITLSSHSRVLFRSAPFRSFRKVDVAVERGGIISCNAAAATT